MEKPAVRVTADNTKHAVLSNMMMVMLVVVVVVRYRQAGRQAGRVLELQQCRMMDDVCVMCISAVACCSE